MINRVSVYFCHVSILKHDRVASASNVPLDAKLRVTKHTLSVSVLIHLFTSYHHKTTQLPQ